MGFSIVLVGGAPPVVPPIIRAVALTALFWVVNLSKVILPLMTGLAVSR